MQKMHDSTVQTVGGDWVICLTKDSTLIPIVVIPSGD